MPCQVPTGAKLDRTAISGEFTPKEKSENRLNKVASTDIHSSTSATSFKAVMAEVDRAMGTKYTDPAAGARRQRPKNFKPTSSKLDGY